MTLSRLVSTLTGLNNITIVLKDAITNNEIAEIKGSTFESLEDTIENRLVARWTIVSVNKIEVVLETPTGTSVLP